MLIQEIGRSLRGSEMKLEPILRTLIPAALMLLLVGCGGDNQAADTPTQLPLATNTPIPPTAIPLSTPTKVPEPMPTSIATVTPASTPVATPTAVPTPTMVPVPTPAPTATLIPTQVPPTPTPLVVHTTVDAFGFRLSIDGEINVESSGLAGDDASANEGIIFFGYEGANAILLWFEDSDSDIDAVLSDNYTSLDESQPDLTFSLMNKGDTAVGSYTAQYYSFITNTASGDSGGGIIGSWRCPPGAVFSLTVTGADATVVQIRFKRLLDGFACGS